MFYMIDTRRQVFSANVWFDEFVNVHVACRLIVAKISLRQWVGIHSTLYEVKKTGKLNKIILVQPISSKWKQNESLRQCFTVVRRIEMDPEYYDYSLCFGNKGYYGYRRYCCCMQGGLSNVKASMMNTTQIFPSNSSTEVMMYVKKGYWPCCGDNVTKLVRCSQQEVFDDETCNPSGDCNCWLQLVNALLQTTCSSSCVCRNGNKGRFCSQCVKGHYKKGSLCVPVQNCLKIFQLF